ncbi:ABC transporter ATP-binding protein/permease [Alphaproteobacteria bacterium]|nr:ABC transporter ATP-binding protein/permease [Alphaproteobacteria bacterium]
MILIGFVKWCLKGAYPALVLAAVASVLLGIVETYVAALLGYLLDLVIETPPNSLFSDKWSVLLVAVTFLFLIRPGSFLLSSYLQSMVVSPGVRTMVATRLHRWTLGHPKSYFDNDFAGRIAQKEVQASNAVADITVEVIHTVLFALASVITSFFIIATIDWRVGMIVALWVVGFYLLMRFFLPRIKSYSADRANAQAAATGQIVDTISNISIVKLFANVKHEDRAALNAFGFLKKSLQAYGTELIRFRASMVVYASSVFFFVMLGCLLLWTNGEITPGEVVAAGSVALRIMMMAGWVSFSLMTIYTNLGDVQDAMQTLAVPHTMIDKKGAPDLTLSEGEIKFDKVSFTYGRNIGGLKDVSLSIKAGEKLGVVGASGAGKSTLVSTLLRLHDPESGAILIDGQNIGDVKQNSLRRNISMVTQDASMFNRTALENILYGKPDASEDEVVEAAKKAGAHDFILSLMDNRGRHGYDAYLGERGVKLSGGQRQRIALARAIIKDAPILVLDEATSALDSEVEAAIQESLETVMAGKTVFAIAHRLSTISHMDRIVVMDEGSIIEEGTHNALLRKKGVYANFWERQSGGFLGVDAAA